MGLIMMKATEPPALFIPLAFLDGKSKNQFGRGIVVPVEGAVPGLIKRIRTKVTIDKLFCMLFGYGIFCSLNFRISDTVL